MFTRDCKYCGKTGLHWETINGKWILHDSKNNKHFCKSKEKPKLPEPKPGAKVYILKDFKPDPLIDKAVKKFKKELKKKKS